MRLRVLAPRLHLFWSLAATLLALGCGGTNTASFLTSDAGDPDATASEAGQPTGEGGPSGSCSSVLACFGKCGQLVACGALVDCGDCAPGATCGGGGVSNRCGTGSCVPDCSAKACGQSNGCDGICSTGSCPSGQQCVAGACQCDTMCSCVPSCSGKACGADDGCGGRCATGTCPSGAICASSSCVACGGSGQPCCDGNACASPLGVRRRDLRVRFGDGPLQRPLHERRHRSQELRRLCGQWRPGVSCDRGLRGRQLHLPDRRHGLRNRVRQPGYRPKELWKLRRGVPERVTPAAPQETHTTVRLFAAWAPRSVPYRAESATGTTSTN